MEKKTSQPNETVFRENLKACRRKARLSAKRAAEYLDISVKAYEEYENGKRSIPVEDMESIAELLGVEPFTLFVEGSHKAYSPQIPLTGLPTVDLKGVAHLKRIAGNYKKMQAIEKRH